MHYSNWIKTRDTDCLADELNGFFENVTRRGFGIESDTRKVAEVIRLQNEEL